MAHALCKEAFFSPARMMASVHWRTLIEEGVLPTIPGWKALITDLRFWQRLVGKTLCRHARTASSRWQYLAAKQSGRLFWSRLERDDPANETAFTPGTIMCTVWICTGRKTFPSIDEESICDSTAYSCTHSSSLIPASTLTAVQSNMMDD